MSATAAHPLGNLSVALVLFVALRSAACCRATLAACAKATAAKGGLRSQYVSTGCCWLLAAAAMVVAVSQITLLRRLSHKNPVNAL